MSSPQGKRDIVRLRTFADDVGRVQTEKGIAAPEAVAVLPSTEAVAESKGILFKVKKKNLNLTDAHASATALNEDGIQFDEEVATKVVDQAYEEHQSIKGDAVKMPEAVTLHQTDSLDVIGKKPKPTLSDFTIAPTPTAGQPMSVMGSQATATPAAQVTSMPIQRAVAGAAPVVANSRVSMAPQVAEIRLNAAETIDQISASPESVQKNKSLTEIAADELREGELVTDKKRERFRLVPAIGQAVGQWFEEAKETIEESQREKHTVSRTEDRIATIKAAASPKTLSPEEDFAEVARKLKETKRTAPETPEIAIKPKHEETPRWTHTTSEAEGPTSVDATIVPEVPTAPEVTQPAAVFVPQRPEPIPTDTALTVPPAPVFPSLSSGGIARPTTGAQGYVIPPARPQSAGPREFLPSPLIALGVVIVAVIAGIGTSLFFFGQQPPAEVVPVATTNPLFTAELQTSIDIGTTHRETMETLLSAVASRSGSLYMYLTRNGGQEVVHPNDVMAFLAPQVPGSFARSVTNVSFGSLDSRPFILIRTNDFDAAFAGMLAWEQTMSADLAPLFGPVVTESFDPQARTSNQARTAFFRDVVANNQSSRLLANERGEDRILYTFVDKQTILIATDRLQLANVIPLIR